LAGIFLALTRNAFARDKKHGHAASNQNECSLSP